MYMIPVLKMSRDILSLGHLSVVNRAFLEEQLPGRPCTVRKHSIPLEMHSGGLPKHKCIKINVFVFFLVLVGNQKRIPTPKPIKLGHPSNRSKSLGYRANR